MSKIQRISTGDALKICSQQVIVDLGRCVKELVENALDAGSTQIEVRLKRYGLDGIEVTDNGTGIDESHFSEITQRHSTSKISRFEDLESVCTFGFRGEALSSICALGKLTVLTATEEAKIGFKLVFNEHGEILEQTQCSRSCGTTVIVSDLFHSLPVRLKDFEKNCKREYHKCVQLIQDYAIVSTGVRLSFVHILNGNRQSIMASSGGSSLKDNITSILGNKIFQTFIEIDLSLSISAGESDDYEIKLSGYISSSQEGYGRKSNDKQFIFVNRRPCSLPKISRKFNEIYKAFNVFQHPSFVILIDLPAGTFDVNVTPDKKTIMIHHETEVLSQLNDQLHEFFRSSKGSFDLNASQTSSSASSQVTFSQPSIESYIEPLSVPKRIVEDESKDSSFIKTVSLSPSLSRETMATESTNSFKALKSSSTLDENLIVEPDENLQPIKQNSKSDFEYEVIHICKNTRHHSPAKDPGPPIPKQNRSSNLLNFSLNGIKKSLEKKLAQKLNASCNVGKTNQEKVPDVDDPEAETILKRIIGKCDFPRMRIIGQFNLGFIIAMLPVPSISPTSDSFVREWDLFVIDQHASDEIFLFHKFNTEANIEMQPVVCPKIVDLPPDQILLALENEEFFRKNGFEIDGVPHKRQLQIKKFPVLYGKVMGISEFHELLSILESDPTKSCRCSRVRSIFASKACRAAFMIGDPLEMRQMRKILDNLSSIERPWNCPHGRPTMRWLYRLLCN